MEDKKQNHTNTWRLALRTDFTLGLSLGLLFLATQLGGCGSQIIEEYEIQNAYTGKIRLNLKHVQNSNHLVVATPPGTSSLDCKIGTQSCSPAGQEPKLLSSVSKPDGLQFFLLPLSAILASDTTLRLQALNEAGNSIDQRNVKFTKGAPTGPTAPTSTTGGASTTGTMAPTGGTGANGAPGAGAPSAQPAVPNSGSSSPATNSPQGTGAGPAADGRTR